MAKSVFEVLMKIEGDQEVKTAIADIGKAAGLAGAALTAFSGAVAKTAADYEFNLAKVGTLATEATGSTEEFDKALFNLTDQMDGAIGANEAAAASYEILSSGFADQTDILSILEQSQKTAIGGYSDLGTISSATTAIINAYGDVLGENLTVTDKVNKVTDQMIQTQNLGVITAGEYATYIGSIASSAASLKIPFEEMNAAIALSTSQGVRVSSTFAGLGQIMAALAKPTKEAQDQAALLGIEFNAAAVESKGLNGVLRDIISSGGDSQESLGKLFGSVEAVRVVTPLLSAEGANLTRTFEGMSQATGVANTAFDKMSETTTVKAQNALKKLNNAFISLGKGVLVAISPVIDALDWLVTNFNKLPDPVKEAIGLLTAIGGVALTIAGSIALLSAAVPAMIASFTAAIPVVTGLAVSLLGLQGVAWGGMVTNMAIVGVAASALAIKLAALALIVKGISLALEHYNNIEIEEKGLKFQEDLAATEPLVKMTEKLVNEMRKTGEAIPDAKFNEYIKLLKEADGGTGLLEKHIKILTDEQNKAKGALEGGNVALQDNALSAEEAAKQMEAYTKKVEAFLSVLNTQKDTAIINLGSQNLGIEERLQKELEITQEYNDKILEQKEALAAQTLLSDEERLKIQSDINKTLAEEAKKVFDTEDQLRELSNKKTLALFDTERVKAETLFANKQVLSQDYYNYLIDLLNKELDYKLALIDEELATTKEGSVEYQELQKERADAILKTTQQGLQIHQQYNQEVIEGETATLEKIATLTDTNVQAFKEANNEKILSDQSYRDAYLQLLEEQYTADQNLLDYKLSLVDQDSKEYADLQAEKITLTQSYSEQVKAIESETLAYKLEQIDLEVEAQQNATQAIIDNRKLVIDQLQNQEQFLGGLSGIISKISSNLEKDNLTLSQRAQLQEVGRDVLRQSAELGLKVNENLSVEQNLKLALNALEIRKLEIQKQQLQLQQEIIKAEAESQALDLSSKVETSKTKLADPNISNQEKQRLQQEIDLNTKKLDLLNKQTEAKLKSNQASQTLLDLEKSLAITTQSISRNPPVTEAKTTRSVNESVGDTSANLQKTANATQESTNKLTNIESISNVSSSNLGSLTSAVTATNNTMKNSTNLLNSTLSTINNSIVNNGNILRNIQTGINNLPKQIAASLPRQSPTPATNSR